MREIEYTLTMNSEQAHETLKAVELLMRLKINQPEEITRAVMPMNYWDGKEIDREKFDDFLHRREDADFHMKLAFGIIFPKLDEIKKDDEWYCLYNLYQVLRYQIHLAEHPDDNWSVDSREPIQFTASQPLPGGSWRVKHEAG